MITRPLVIIISLPIVPYLVLNKTIRLDISDVKKFDLNLIGWF